MHPQEYYCDASNGTIFYMILNYSLYNMALFQKIKNIMQEPYGLFYVKCMVLFVFLFFVTDHPLTAPIHHC